MNPVWVCLGLATRKHLNLHLDSSKDLFTKNKGMLYIYIIVIYIYTHIVLICCIFIITYNIYFCRRHARHPPSRHLTLSRRRSPQFLVHPFGRTGGSCWLCGGHMAGGTLV